MVKLKDILELTCTVTHLSLDVREPEHLRLIQAYEIGEGCNEENATTHERHRMAKGELIMIDKNINYFGTKKGKSVENGWGTIFDNIPADLLAMEVRHFRQSSRGGWEHVSIALLNQNMPTWADMCWVKSQFWDDEETVMQLHPKKSEYVNNKENCLHLWRPLNCEIPTPPKIFV